MTIHRLMALTVVLLLAAGAATAQEQLPAPPPQVPLTGIWEFKDPYIGEQNDLKVPNRTPEEISAWTRQRASEALSFTPDKIDSDLQGLKRKFVQKGWEEYAAYLRDSDILNRVRMQGYSVVTIAEGEPLILTSGEKDGSFHWVVELPVMVTLQRANGGDAPPASGGAFNLIMQIGRVADMGLEGLAIESWKMTRRPPSK